MPRSTPPATRRKNRVRITGARAADRPAATGPDLPGTTTEDPPPAPPVRDLYVDQDHPRTEKDQAAMAKKAAVAAFLRTSVKRWRTASAADAKVRGEQQIDQQFAAGNQWDADTKTERLEDERPALTINRIPQFMRQVKNQMRAARPSIQINARKNGARTEIASVFQGLCRSIEVDSDAEIAYDTGADHQVSIGRGYLRVTNEWDSVTSWEQVIRIKRVRNPFTVFVDPSCEEFDYSDARWMHIVTKVPKDDYDARWGKVAPYASLTEMATDAGLDLTDWMPEGYVVVAQYFYIDSEEKELLLLDDGASMYRDAYDALVKTLQPPAVPADAGAGPVPPMGALVPPPLGAPTPPPIPEIIRSRTVQVPVAKWALHNAVAILEGNADRSEGRRIPGTRCPVIPIIGEELDLNGEVDYRGMVRDARDPQQMYNFWATKIAETVTLAPLAPWVVATGQIEQYAEIWEMANRRTYSSLPYDPVTVDGQLAPPPQRNVVEPPIQALVVGLREADNDLKAVMGLFEPSLGAPSPEHSGKAILARQQAGQIANSNFLDNQARMIRSLGRLLIEWIPTVYDTARIVHLTMDDGKKQAVLIHAGAAHAPTGPPDPHTGQPTPFQLPEGVKGVFDLSVGQYDVAVSVRSYQELRHEAAANMIELFKAIPKIGEIGADIFLENSDWEGAQQLAKRVKKALPPGVLDDHDSNAELAQLRQQMDLVKKQFDAMTQIVERQRQQLHERRIEAESKERIAEIQANASMTTAVLKMGSERDRTLFDAEFARLQQTLDHIQERITQRMAQDHELDLEATSAAVPGNGGPPAGGGAPASG